MNCRIVCNKRPKKAEANRKRVTVDGSRITINRDMSTPAADLQTVKLLLNSIVSTPNANFLGLDLKDLSKSAITRAIISTDKNELLPSRRHVALQPGSKSRRQRKPSCQSIQRNVWTASRRNTGPNLLCRGETQQGWIVPRRLYT